MSETLKEIGSTVAKLRALLSERKKDLLRIQSLQDVLTSSLDVLWESTNILIQDQRLWKETLALVASGKVLSVAAQAEHALDVVGDVEREKSWISSGSDYCRWIGKGVVGLCEGGDHGETATSNSIKAAARLLGKGLTLGHDDTLVHTVLEHLISGQMQQQLYQCLIASLTSYEQRHVLLSTLRIISTNYLPSSISSESQIVGSSSISASSALLKYLLNGSPQLGDDLCNYLTSTPSSIYLARVAIAALPLEQTEKLLQKVWEQFGDKLHIRHDPILQQESTARLLLLCMGYIYRAEPMSILMHARSSLQSNAMSNRLGSSSARVRLLAMFVGEAVSELVDKEKGSRMNFELEGDEAVEAGLWKKLVQIEEKPGLIKDLASQSSKPRQQGVNIKPEKILTAKKEKAVKPMIVEVLDDEEEDDNLVSYAKPDSDTEDSDEDATLVERNKPKPPVYIRDLISALLDTSNPTTHTLALRTAPSLIRRKANFGTELLDQLPNLASALTNLQDHFEDHDFHDLYQASMIATIVAQPKVMGPWYVRESFVGDYSIGQRGAMLVAVGLAARELGGFGRIKSDVVNNGEADETFPTKMLPERLHKVYAGIGNGSRHAETKGALMPAQTAEVDTLARVMGQTMLVPLSTRKSASAGKQRTKIIRNDLASVMAEAFFFPLTGYFHASMQSRSTTSPFLTTPSLLTLYLKTLAILLQSAGPSVLILPQLTSEFWTLLLALRSQALKDASVLEAILFGFLTLLVVNEGHGERRRLATECGRELVETREWVGGVWEGLDGGGGGSGERGGLAGLGMGEEGGVLESGGGGNEQDRCKVLAAGVLMQIKEVVDQYQRLMVGNLVMP